MNSVLSIRNVNKKFGKVNVLNDININLKPTCSINFAERASKQDGTGKKLLLFNKTLKIFDFFCFISTP